MPIYEYQCRECGQKARKFWRSFAAVDDASLQCPCCGAHSFQRLVSRVAVLRSQDSHLEDLADPSSLADLDENDPKSMARWMRKMGDEMGEDLGPEFEEVVDRLETGQSPEDIEDALPDLGAGAEDSFMG